MNAIRTSLLAVPLLAMSAFCVAQSAATPPASASPTDKAAGNNLTGPQDPSPNAAANPANPPASASEQQKATGNNLVTQQQPSSAMAARPTFASLDTKKAGYLTEQDAAGNQWFKANFSKCDLNHDNKVTSDEFASCSK